MRTVAPLFATIFNSSETEHKRRIFTDEKTYAKGYEGCFYMTKKDFIAFYAELPEDKMEMVKKWTEELFFMEKTLKKLRKIINDEGSIIRKMTGNGFEVDAENPAQTAYNIMIRNYNATLKHLSDMRPNTAVGDELTDFIKSKRERRSND